MEEAAQASFTSGRIGTVLLVLVAMTEGPTAGCTMMGPWLFGRDLQQQQQQQMIMMMMKTIAPPTTAPLPTSDISYHHAKKPK